MNNGTDIRVQVTGGDSWKERELVADTIAVAMQDRGFNQVTALNSMGGESELYGVKPRTVWEAVNVVASSLVNRTITVDPGLDSKHPGLAKDFGFGGHWQHLANTGMSVYNPDEQGHPESEPAQFDNTTVMVRSGEHSAIMDLRNRNSPEGTINGCREMGIEATHVGIRASDMDNAVAAVAQALRAAPGAYVTVSVREPNSNRGGEPPEQLYFNDPAPKTIHPFQVQELPGRGFRPFTETFDRSMVLQDNPGSFLLDDVVETDPNHSKIVEMVKQRIENTLQDSEKSLANAREHLAAAQHSIDQVEKLEAPGLKDQVTQMVKTNLQASGGYDNLSDKAVEELAAVAVGKGFQNAKSKLAVQNGGYTPPTEDEPKTGRRNKK